MASIRSAAGLTGVPGRTFRQVAEAVQRGPHTGIPAFSGAGALERILQAGRQGDHKIGPFLGTPHGERLAAANRGAQLMRGGFRVNPEAMATLQDPTSDFGSVMAAMDIAGQASTNQAFQNTFAPFVDDPDDRQSIDRLLRMLLGA